MAAITDASLKGLKRNPQFLASCEYVQNEVANKNPPRLALASVVDYNAVDVKNRVTEKEMPIEDEMATKIEAAAGYVPTELFLITRRAHKERRSLEFLVDMYDNYRLSATGEITVAGAKVTPSESSDVGKLEAFYLRIKFFKYHLYNESNHVTRAHYQRVNTFLIMCMLARFWRFKNGAGAELASAPNPLTAAEPPLRNLLIPCKAATDNSGNATLSSIAELSMHNDASASSKLVANLRKTQTALQRAVTSIDDARRLRMEQEIQLIGYVVLTAVSLLSFYGLYKFKHATWLKYKWYMAVMASLGAMAILMVTVYSIIKPVERFETYYEEFCNNTADTCTPAMIEWAAEATKQTYLTVADGTTQYAKNLLTSRNNAMTEELDAITRRVNATDVEYREDMYLFNRVRQIKRFVIMAFVVALLLMTVMVLGVPTNVVVGIHIFAAVIICITGILVYRGNTQRMRKNFHQIYYPKPDTV
jgi:hypothetical protein